MLFICHNCSDIHSPAGEACLLHADISRKEFIISGKAPCLRKYTIINKPLQEEMAAGGLISSDIFPVETDFYIMQSEEAETSLSNVTRSPLWDVESFVWKFTEDDMRIEQQYKERMETRIGVAHERKVSNVEAEAIKYCSVAKPCTLDSDPINLIKSRWNK